MKQELVAVKRRVYFLSGFDPRGSSFYYRLFAEQLKAYSVRSSRALTISRREGQKDPLVSSWQVHERGAPLLEVCFLHWDDIIRDNWPSSPSVIVWQGFLFALWYLLGGGLLRIAHLCPTVALCGLYPLLFFGLSCSLLSILALFVYSISPGWLGLLLATAATLLCVPLCWRLAEKQGVIWLFRSILFTHRLGQSRDSLLRPRLTLLAQRLLAREEQLPAQLIRLVGHSSGSFVMAMLAAELIRQPSYKQRPELEQKISMLSLGQNFANLGVHSKASAFRKDLIDLSMSSRFPWLDITSRDDYLCFAAVDPYRGSRIHLDGSGYPELKLVRLAQRLGLNNWPRLITNQFDLHFQYLYTAPDDLRGGFDYFEEILGDLAHA